ncbi:DUF4007 family protein [Aliiglaciecola sp. NS0011-25]|uniref:DUF4007 family protein n=1 Tax=Aliiglaciecola sp. NS0011-25 TaxID=3127654 RepID=UPI00310B24FA
MSLINNQTFPFNKWWFHTAMSLVEKNPSCFSSKYTAQTMAVMIAGSNVVKAIQEWLIASGIVESAPKQTYRLTNFGKAIHSYDSKLEHSGTWWAIHFALAFSKKADTYSQYFIEFDCQNRPEIILKDLEKNIIEKFEASSAVASIEKSFQGVNRLFDKHYPFSELGLIEKSGDGSILRIGTPDLTNDIIIHALITVKYQLFPSRESVSFSQFCEESNIHKFLCISAQELRKQLIKLSQSTEFGKLLSFQTSIDIESLSFNDELTPHKTMLRLIQTKEETWK